MSYTRKNKKKTRQPIAVGVFDTTTVKGEVVVRDKNNGVILDAVFSMLPSGKHGFHIHTMGDLRGDGCMGACSHYNVGPTKHHGDAPGSKRERHTGDLGNIEMPPSGQLKKTYFIKGTSLAQLYGRTLIVHADEDDLGLGGHHDSKTTGHSGARIACAILGRGIEEL